MPPAEDASALIGKPKDLVGVGNGAGFGDGGMDLAGKGMAGEVVVLHYYQQHHQYLLKVAVLDAMNRSVLTRRAVLVAARAGKSVHGRRRRSWKKLAVFSVSCIELCSLDFGA